MFLHLSVSRSVDRGWFPSMHHWSNDWGNLHPGGSASGGSASRGWGVCILGMGVCIQGGSVSRGVCIRGWGSASRGVGQTPLWILQHMVNEPMVRILLQCILVVY